MSTRPRTLSEVRYRSTEGASPVFGRSRKVADAIGVMPVAIKAQVHAADRKAVELGWLMTWRKLRVSQQSFWVRACNVSNRG